jgi:ubiquinone/menaquinone biosynthesis C-methylase UbiE
MASNLATRLLSKALQLVSTEAWAAAYVGGGDFQAIGQEFRRHFIAAGLKSHHDILDIGCGTGRMASALADYVTTGSYTGIDISKRAIRYCRERIPLGNFRFIHAEVYNQIYNWRGVKASEYRLPFEGDSFDFVFLTSVFTHLLQAEAENYLHEIGRVLRPGGICFSTWFLLKDIENMGIPMTRMNEVCAVRFPKKPSAAIAFDYGFVESLYARNHLAIRNVFLGSWARSRGLSWQDIVTAVKS